MNIRRVLSRVEKPQGLYPNFLSPVTGSWVQRGYPLPSPPLPSLAPAPAQEMSQALCTHPLPVSS